MKKHRTRTLIVTIALAVTVTVAGFGLTYYLTEQTGCELGRAIVTNERLETPIFTVNAPYMGTAETNGYVNSSPVFLFRSGSLTIMNPPDEITNDGNGDYMLTQGSITGLLNGKFWPTGPAYMTGHWTIYSVHNATMNAVGPLHPCTTPFIAENTFIENSGGNANLFLPNNTTDIGESTQPYGGYGIWPVVQLYSAYNNSNYPEVDTCSSPGTTLTFNGWAEVPIGIPFSYEGQNRTVMGQLLWEGYSSQSLQAPTLSYQFPGYFGIWQIDSFAGNNTLGFLSFNYEPC